MEYLNDHKATFDAYRAQRQVVQGTPLQAVPRDSLGAELHVLHDSLAVLEKEVASLEDSLHSVSDSPAPIGGEQNAMGEAVLPPALAEVRRARRLVDSLTSRIAAARHRLAL
jgi:hypothetical protein